MEMQAEAERKKRAQILESEGNQFNIPTLQMSKDDIILLSF
jgi:regulator of protease activity HflC (stomatin/prohibitin superfamily)